jgi:hypothetical protein
VPALKEASGAANLTGVFDLGEGLYQVDWIMHDFAGRFCSSFWEVDAALSPKDRQVAVALPARAIRRTEIDQFQPEPPVLRAAEAPLNVKVLLNFAPERASSASIDPLDAAALVSIIRNLSRNPKIGRFSLVAFNIREQKVFYRQDAADHIDFPALGKALKNVNLGTVSARQLEQRNGDAQFLTTLIKNEAAAEHNAPDGLIFIGPKTLVDVSVTQDDLKQMGDLDYPVFYMNYAPDPVAVPWKDAISRTVKFFKGREYTITGPRDLWNAAADVVSKIAKSRQTHGNSNVPSSAPR